MGPWAKILHSAVFGTGKAIGKKVKLDALPPASTITHADRIRDLATDSGVSASYLQELVERSGVNKESLEAIKQYLTDPSKAGNLSPDVRGTMVDTIQHRMTTIHDAELLHDLMQLLRTKAEFLEDLANLLS